VAMTLEPRVEQIFHSDSYGYRPGRSAHDALEACRERCLKKPWVLDLDIRAFFDSLDHDLVVKAVGVNTTPEPRWVLLYVKRWLQAPLQLPDGTLQARERGTPQGSAVSPVLANLVLHYAFDRFLAREFPVVTFERYADDAVVHCATERQARQVWAALSERLGELGLELHPDKTRIVYCKDDKRRGDYPHTSFTFLGFTFQPRGAKTKRGHLMVSFLPAVSAFALVELSREARQWRLHTRTRLTLGDLAAWINPIVRGWLNYYGRFRPSALYPLLQRINTYLMRWAGKKYKRLRSYKRFKAWWFGIIEREPTLFAVSSHEIPQVGAGFRHVIPHPGSSRYSPWGRRRVVVRWVLLVVHAHRRPSGGPDGSGDGQEDFRRGGSAGVVHALGGGPIAVADRGQPQPRPEDGA
jgi:RNA-directed DNA polymerase